MKQTVAVIIPAYNEAQTIADVLAAVVNWGQAKEIIVVSDGSTDATNTIVRQFPSQIELIVLRKNYGKGNALATGIAKSHADVLVFLDADIKGLKGADIIGLVDPVLKNQVDMVIGVHNFWGIGKFRPYNSLSGQRVLRRSWILPYVSDLRRVGGGAEFVINHIYKGAKVRYKEQSHVFTLRKIDKWPLGFALLAYIRQAGEFVKGMLWQFQQ